LQPGQGGAGRRDGPGRPEQRLLLHDHRHPGHDGVRDHGGPARRECPTGLQERHSSVLRNGRAAVLGKPIGHALSPVIHNAGYRAADLAEWSYTAHECASEDLARFVAGLDAEWVGLSLTMPLKEVALDVADEVAPVAAAIGAANTLVRLPDGTW